MLNAMNVLDDFFCHTEKVCLPCDQQRIQLTSWKQTNEAGDCCVQLQEVLYMMEEVSYIKTCKQYCN